MPKDQQTHGAPRQRPVSCRSCRARKLRCSREVPCANCVSRGIRCELEYPAGPSPGTFSASEPEIVKRVRKLEELVEKQKSQQNASVKQHSESSDDHAQQAHRSTLSPQIEHLGNDVAWLESIYSGQDLSVNIICPQQQFGSDQKQQDKIPSNKVVFRVCSIQHIMEARPYINQSAFLSSTSFEPARCVWLPQYPEAKILLDKFIQDIDHVHHVVHTPSLPSMLDEFYACVNQQGQVKPGNMILLLSIFASCTHSWVRRDCELGLFSTSAEANNQSPLWVKAIEDVLDIAHRTTCVSIEGIQGIIIASFVSANFEGFSRRCRSLYNMALLLARELGLHCLDHPSNANLANSAQAEIGRRVWWYLVASDWSIAARFVGVAQGVYQCHMRQMLVRKPLNINDEDLIDGMSRIEQPLSQPTTMSYSLQRIRLSEISRSIVDRTPLITAHAGGPSHDVVMDIDTELQLLINDIPPFFSLSIANLTKTYQLDPSRAASIFHQGNMFYSLLYAQRCRLHFPYFSRGYVDSAYASSREICVQSARLIIQTESQLENSGLCTATRYKFIRFLLGVFMASIVLLMDLCHNKWSPQQEKQRREIAHALRILEEARHESETAAKFLDSLMHVLRKHKVSPPERAAQQPLKPGIGTGQLSIALDGAMVYNAATTQPDSEPAVVSIPMASSSVLGRDEASSINMTGDRFTDGEDLSSYFNELAQSFEHGVDVGSFDWNNIFSGLDPSFI